MSRLIKNLSGKKFGKITVLRFAEIKNTNAHWLCQCDCGELTIVSRCSLINKKTTSCGCLRRYIYGNDAKLRPRFLTIWKGIQQRCYDKHSPAYKNYGDRGIECEWKKYKDFKYDMYKSYLKHVEKHDIRQTTIDRINNNSNYCKKNCKWSTYKMQQRNRRNNHLLTYKGETCCLAEWAERIRIKPNTLWARITQSKWSVEKALTTPLQK